MLGDSIAAGLGADAPKHTLGGGLARRVAKRTGRAVRLRTVARVGSESSELAGQVAGLPAGYRADAAVIVVGGNDVTHRVPTADSVRHLTEAIEALAARGTPVVVGTCPDLGALRPVPQPLRSLGSRASRQLAAAQRDAALAAGARAVSLAHVVGPFFITNPDEMFSLDRFHPEHPRLQADGGADAALGARGARVRRVAAVRAPRTGSVVRTGVISGSAAGWRSRGPTRRSRPGASGRWGRRGPRR